MIGGQSAGKSSVRSVRARSARSLIISLIKSLTGLTAYSLLSSNVTKTLTPTLEDRYWKLLWEKDFCLEVVVYVHVVL